MALVFMEGFDFFATSQFVTRGWSSTNLNVTGGRFGGQAVLLKNSQQANITKSLPGTYTTVICGFAVLWLDAVESASYTLQLNGANVRTNGTHFTVTTNGGTLVATGSATLATNVWYYVEVKIVYGASGSCELYVNGVSDIASTAFASFGTNVSNLTINEGGALSNNRIAFDDIYVCDTTGSTNNTFLGDSRVATIKPNGAGSHTQWTPLTGTNWGEVSETIADGDSSYNSDHTVNDIDSFTTGGIDVASTVFGVQNNLYARKDDTGTRQIAGLVRQSSTDYVGATGTLGTSYSFFSDLYNQDPTASNWTAANVNADEFGYKLIA